MKDTKHEKSANMWSIIVAILAVAIALTNTTMYLGETKVIISNNKERLEEQCREIKELRKELVSRTELKNSMELVRTGITEVSKDVKHVVELVNIKMGTMQKDISRIDKKITSKQ